MNWADWTILAILTISGLISLKRGFVREALSLLTWAVAVGVAVIFHSQLAQLLGDSIQTPSLRNAVAFGLLFICTLIVGALVNYLLGELVRMTGLTGTDRLFGVMFGVLRGMIVVMLAIIFIPEVLPVAQDPWWQESVLIPHFVSLEDWSRQVTGELSDSVMQLFQ